MHGQAREEGTAAGVERRSRASVLRTAEGAAIAPDDFRVGTASFDAKAKAQARSAADEQQ